MKKTALITGICGQDGSYLGEHLISMGYNVIGATKNVDKDKANKNILNIINKIDLIEWPYNDQLNIDKIIEKYNPQEIYNFAGYTSGIGMNLSPAEYSELNAMSVIRILDSVNRINKDIKFLQASSREIFGNPSESPQHEETLKNPRSIYGASKLYADNIVKIYREDMKLFACSAILYNHESPRRKSEFITQKIVKGAIRVKKGLDSKLEIGNLDATRDWGNAKEFVNAMYLILQNKNAEDYIIATGVSFTVRDICEIVFNYLDLNYEDFVKTNSINFRENETVPLVGNIEKIKRNINWIPKKSLVDTIVEMIKEELKN